MTDFIVEDLSECLASPAAMLAADEACDEISPRSARARPLPRPRLALRLDDEQLAPLTIVNAPSGFGKSTLLQQWNGELAALGIATLRLVIHCDDATWTSTDRLIPTRIARHDALLPFVCNWLDTRAHGVVLVDDGHLLSDDDAQSLCGFFLASDPSTHALVMATRRPLPVRLARARAHGLVRDIGTGELQLSRPELEHLFEQRRQRPLKPGTATQLLQMTGGWPAAADACARRMAGIGVANMLLELKRGSGLMDDFFDEEVLAPLAEPLRQFLVGASVLGILTAEVCDVALDISDGAERMAQAIQAGLFIEAVDGRRGEFRLNVLFEQYLQSLLKRRGRDARSAIALRASAWFERNDRLPEAFECAVRAEAWDIAAELLDRYCVHGCMTGQGPQVTAMALKLPQHSLGKYPRAAVFAARGASTDWRFGLVEDFLQLAHATSAINGANDVDGLVRHSRMLTSQYSDDQVDAGRRCLELLEEADGLDHYTRGTIFGSLLYARREQFDFTDVTGLEAAGVREFNLSERPLGMVWHLSVLGPTHALRGDLAGAARRLEEASDIAADLVEAEWIASVPALLLAEIFYERNEIPRSQALIAKYHPAPLVGYIDQYVAAYSTAAKLRWLDGDINGAHRCLDDGMALAENRALERLRQAMLGERIRLLLACGQTQRALDIGKQEKWSGDPATMQPATPCTTRDEMRAMSWSRLALARGQPSDAADVGQAWKRFTVKAGAIRSAMRWEILLAQAYLAQGQTARAQRELRSALSRAVAGGYIRSFLDEGEPVRRLLQNQLDASTIQTDPTDFFVAKMLEAGSHRRAEATPAVAGSRDRDVSAATAPLGKSEIEILRMASAGLQNREIAQRIGMTEGSVKWYMQQIFNKIGIRKRAGALERARSLGLLT